MAASPFDPKRLLVFRTVARAGSISAGARELGWTQPAVSQHLAALERSAGMPLLLRSPKGVELTEPGHALLVHADALAARLEDARAEVDAFADRRAGRVRVAAFPSGAVVILPPVMRALRDSHPTLRVDLSEAEPPHALAALHAGDVDLALTFTYDPEEEHDPDIASVTAGSDETRLVVPRDYDYGVLPAQLTKLRDEAWIAGCPRCRTHLLATATAAGFTPDIRHTTDDYVLVQALVAQRLGVALLPQTALRAYQHPEVIAVPAAKTQPRVHRIAYRQGAHQVPAIATVIRALLHRAMEQSRLR